MSHKILTASNCLTFLRIILTPFVILYIYKGRWDIAFSIFFIAAITDLFDGYLARQFKAQTKLGAWLDPIADKCLIFGSLSSLLTTHKPLSYVAIIMSAIFIIRELCLSLGISIVLWYHKGPISPCPVWWGKCTMFLQSAFIGFLLVCYVAGWYPYKLFYLLLCVLATTSCISLAQYYSKFIQTLH